MLARYINSESVHKHVPMLIEIQYANLHKSCDTENGEAIECGRKVNIGQPYGLASKMPTRRHAYIRYLTVHRQNCFEPAALKDEDYSHASQRRQHEARPTPPASPAQTSRPAPKPAWREPLRRDHDLSTRYIHLPPSHSPPSLKVQDIPC